MRSMARRVAGRSLAAVTLLLCAVVLVSCEDSTTPAPQPLEVNRAASREIPGIVADAAQEPGERSDLDVMMELGRRQFRLAQDDEWFDVPWIGTELVRDAGIDRKPERELLEFIDTYPDSESFEDQVDRERFEEELLAALVHL